MKLLSKILIIIVSLNLVLTSFYPVLTYAAFIDEDPNQPYYEQPSYEEPPVADVQPADTSAEDAMIQAQAEADQQAIDQQAQAAADQARREQEWAEAQARADQESYEASQRIAQQQREDQERRDREWAEAEARAQNEAAEGAKRIAEEQARAAAQQAERDRQWADAQAKSEQESYNASQRVAQQQFDQAAADEAARQRAAEEAARLETLYADTRAAEASYDILMGTTKVADSAVSGFIDAAGQANSLIQGAIESAGSAQVREDKRHYDPDLVKNEQTALTAATSTTANLSVERRTEMLKEAMGLPEGTSADDAKNAASKALAAVGLNLSGDLTGNSYTISASSTVNTTNNTPLSARLCEDVFQTQSEIQGCEEESKKVAADFVANLLTMGLYGTVQTGADLHDIADKMTDADKTAGIRARSQARYQDIMHNGAADQYYTDPNYASWLVDPLAYKDHPELVNNYDLIHSGRLPGYYSSSAFVSGNTSDKTISVQEILDDIDFNPDLGSPELNAKREEMLQLALKAQAEGGEFALGVVTAPLAITGEAALLKGAGKAVANIARSDAAKAALSQAKAKVVQAGEALTNTGKIKPPKDWGEVVDSSTTQPLGPKTQPLRLDPNDTTYSAVANPENLLANKPGGFSSASGVQVEPVKFEYIAADPASFASSDTIIVQKSFLNDGAKEGRALTEPQAVTELNNFLNAVERVALDNGDTAMTNSVKEFKDKFVYIGRQQFEDATDAMASRIDALAQGLGGDTGKKVVVFVKEAPRISAGDVVDVSGDTFIASHVLGKVNSEAQSQVVLMTDPRKVAQVIASEGADNVKVVVIDDVVASGNQMQNAVLFDVNNYSPNKNPGLLKAMQDAGLDPAVAAKSIEVDVMSKGTNAGTHYSFDEAGVQLNSYFNVRNQNIGEFRSANSSVTSFYSSTDYGFDEVITQYQGYWQTATGTNISRPVLSGVERPYKPMHPDFQVNYQKWLDTVQRFGNGV